MIVTVGDAEGLNLINHTVLFKIPANATGLWNSVTALKDSAIIALTSTNAYGKIEVRMIKREIIY